MEMVDNYKIFAMEKWYEEHVILPLNKAKCKETKKTRVCILQNYFYRKPNV